MADIVAISVNGVCSARARARLSMIHAMTLLKLSCPSFSSLLLSGRKMLEMSNLGRSETGRRKRRKLLIPRQSCSYKLKAENGRDCLSVYRNVLLVLMTI